ncbi:MAG: type II toxin-antitoxin system HicA family toxin [Dehalococcoidia bacterium]|nr:type II toxin-antitoxin system HicA family toxin [Dehalococcoidia bacterium]MDH5781519.1 type II toxin-antitoxin system HicA family toxin [Dehalococcoidia bacterium]
MAELSPVSWAELIRRLRKLGFEGPYRGGKHPYMIKGSLVLTIPNPHRREIGVALLSRILKRAGVTREEWLGQ